MNNEICVKSISFLFPYLKDLNSFSYVLIRISCFHYELKQISTEISVFQSNYFGYSMS